MKIEIIVGELGLVQGFRMNWKPWAKHRPDPRFVFEIYKSDVIPLANFLAGRPVILGDENRHDAQFGHRLFLIALDLANPEVFKDRNYFGHFA